MKKAVPFLALFGALALYYLYLNAKLGIFNLPFFWDELGVYSRAAIHQTVHGLGLLPKNLPDVLSRGHPMLTPFIFAASFKVFGIKIVVARICGLVIYITGVAFGYGILKKSMNPFWAATFSFCIAIQPAFAAQSILVLPEVLLMTITIASLYFFLNQSHIILVICLCLAVMVKESALVLPIAFGISQYLISKKWKVSLVLITIPIITFIAFLIVQKVQNGYYLYPLHQGLMDFSPSSILEKTGKNLNFLFLDQGRWALSLGILAATIYNRVNGISKNLPRFLSWATLWIILGGIAFSSFNYFLARYTLFYLFPLLLLIFTWVAKQKEWMKFTFVFISIIATFYNLSNKKVFVDTDFAYVNHVRSMESAFDYLQFIPTESKVGYNWPMVMANWTSESGYQLPKHKIDEVTMNNITEFDFIVVSHPGNEVSVRDENPTNLTLIKKIDNGYASIAIYKVIQTE